MSPPDPAPHYSGRDGFAAQVDLDGAVERILDLEDATPAAFAVGATSHVTNQTILATADADLTTLASNAVQGPDPTKPSILVWSFVLPAGADPSYVSLYTFPAVPVNAPDIVVLGGRAQTNGADLGNMHATMIAVLRPGWYCCAVSTGVEGAFQAYLNKTSLG